MCVSRQSLGTRELELIFWWKKWLCCCRESKVGKKLPTAFYVHISALATLDSILTIYEKCARQNVPNVDEATLVKFQLRQPKISYLFYPDFDTDAHPALQTSIQINLETGEVKCQSTTATAKIRQFCTAKETFVTTDYPNYEKFARLTRSPRKNGDYLTIPVLLALAKVG